VDAVSAWVVELMISVRVEVAVLPAVSVAT
jgi:hypothetical protein